MRVNLVLEQYQPQHPFSQVLYSITSLCPCLSDLHWNGVPAYRSICWVGMFTDVRYRFLPFFHRCSVRKSLYLRVLLPMAMSVRPTCDRFDIRARACVLIFISYPDCIPLCNSLRVRMSLAYRCPLLKYGTVRGSLRLSANSTIRLVQCHFQ